MAKILGEREIEERKRALIAESEIYRQTLILEVQNIRLYSVRVQKKLAWLRMLNPILMVAGSLLGPRWFRGRERRKRRGLWSRILGGALLGWRLSRRFSPAVRSLLFGRSRARPSSAQAEARVPEASG